MPESQQEVATGIASEQLDVLLRRILESTADQALHRMTGAPPDTVERLRMALESINHVPSGQQQLDVLLHAAMNMAPAAQRGTVYLATSEGHTYLVGATFPDQLGLVGSEIEAQGGYIDAVAYLQCPVVIADTQKEDLIAYKGRPSRPPLVRSALVAPVVVGGQVVGVLALENCERAQAFSTADLDSVSLLATCAALAVDRARVSTSASVVAQRSELSSWRALAQLLPLGILLVSPHQHDLWANDAFRTMARLSPEESANWARMSLVFGQDIGDLCLKSTAESHEMSLMCGDGARFPVTVAFSRILPPRLAGLDGYIAIVESQRERMDLEEKLFHMQRLSDVGALLSSISHELNNPLTAVIGFSELVMAREGVPDESREDLSTVVRQAERSVRIVRDLLDYVRLQSEGTARIDINDVIRQLVRFRARTLRRNGLEVTANLLDELPPVVGNSRQLQQVLLNLVNNAEQACSTANREGKLWIDTRMADREGFVHISIRDNGPGVPPAIEDRIFEPFFTTKSSGEGTGLGLSICRQIVERHKGSLWLENDPGKGATFCIELPASACPPAVTACEKNEPLPQASTLSARILVVDDEKSIGQLLLKLLTRLGHKVDIVLNGSQAIHNLEETAYDIVLLDLRIPGISGQAVYTWIKRDRPQLAKRTVILTGDTLSNETMSFLNEENVLRLLKPFQLAEVRTLMQQIWP